VPEFAILGNAALDALAVATTPSLAGLGPRARAKYGDELLRIVAAHGPDHYFPAVDQVHAQLMERIEAGERMFRSGTTRPEHEPFELLVERLRNLRERGLIDMPEPSAAHASDAGADASGAAGPCYLTDAGRAELLHARRGDRRR
jgi:hypothetical protein